jgi:hypothetical protein
MASILIFIEKYFGWKNRKIAVDGAALRSKKEDYDAVLYDLPQWLLISFE